MISDQEFETLVDIFNKWRNEECSDAFAKKKISEFIEEHIKNLPTKQDEVSISMDGPAGKMKIDLKGWF